MPKRSIYDPTWDIGHSHAILLEAVAAVQLMLLRGDTSTGEIITYIETAMKEAGCNEPQRNTAPCRCKGTYCVLKDNVRLAPGTHCTKTPASTPIRKMVFRDIADKNTWHSWRFPGFIECLMCGDAPCQGCNSCCGSKLGRDPEDGSCRGCG